MRDIAYPACCEAHWPLCLCLTDVLMWQVRGQLHRQAGRHNVVIMSYDALRADIDWVARRQWGYAVLDEGHIIRNPKSQISQACPDYRLSTCRHPPASGARVWSRYAALRPHASCKLRSSPRWAMISERARRQRSGCRRSIVWCSVGRPSRTTSLSSGRCSTSSCQVRDVLQPPCSWTRLLNNERCGHVASPDLQSCICQATW